MPGHPLDQPERLRALAETRLMDSPPEESFDLLTRLCQRLIGVPVILISLVDDHRQFFKAAIGLAGDVSRNRETPLTHSFCQHVVTTGQPLEVADATTHPLVCDKLAIRDLPIRSYLGYPLISPDGFTLGSLCAIDLVPRTWSNDDRLLLHDLSRMVNDRIDLRVTRQRFADTKTRLQKVAAQVPGMIYQYLIRPDGSACFPYASEAIREVYRVTPEEVQESADKVFAIIHPDDFADVAASVQQSAQDLTRWYQEYRVAFPDGTTEWLLGDAIPERLNDGSVLWHGYISNVTARKYRETEFRETMERFRSCFDYAGIGIATLEPNGRWLTANNALLSMLGYTLAELKQLTFQDITHPEDFSIGPALVHQLLSGEIQVARAAKRYRRADGSYIWCQLTTAVIRDDAGQPKEFVTQLEDVTALRTATAERAAMDRKLAETAKLESLGILAGGIAHDFNNILTGVLGNASLLKIELPPHSPQLESLDQIETSARRAADLCRQMLAYSGKGRFIVKPLDLNIVIKDTTRLLEISISKQTNLRFLLAPQLPAIEADETQLRQIVMNLVINGSEAIGERFGVVGVATGISVLSLADTAGLPFEESISPGEYVWMEVSDNGDGMSPEVAKKIFDPFFTTKFAGRGLGLAAVQGIIRGHKGSIKVYSEVGKGTTFRLLFPAVKGPADHATVFGSTSSPSNFHGTALIVDDDPSVRNVASRILRHVGFEVESAVDGAIGIERFRSNPRGFSFVLLDLTMPHLDGAETFRQMRQLNPDIRVILMSGFNSQETITRFAGRGLAGFVPKPLDTEVLLRVVREVLQAPLPARLPGEPSPPRDSTT